MPEVSVIIPTYNRSNLVREAVQSVLQQSYTDFEILVIDDGSTDNTRSVIEQVSDSRISYYYKDNGGCASARNFGAAKARGDFIAFLDSDDLWPTNYLEVILSQLDANKNYDATYTRVIESLPDGRERRLSSLERCRSGQLTKYFFGSGPCLLPSAICFRRSVWKDMFWDEQFKAGVDYDVFLRISTRTRFLFVPDAYVIKRWQPDSISSQTRLAGKLNVVCALERFYFHLGGDKYVPLRVATRRISCRFRSLAKRHLNAGDRRASILLFKRAIHYRPSDIRLYWDLLKACLLDKDKDNMPGWKMPELLKEPIYQIYGQFSKGSQDNAKSQRHNSNI